MSVFFGVLGLVLGVWSIGSLLDGIINGTHSNWKHAAIILFVSYGMGVLSFLFITAANRIDKLNSRIIEGKR